LFQTPDTIITTIGHRFISSIRYDDVFLFQKKGISKNVMEILRGNKLVILDEEGEYPAFVPPAQPAQMQYVTVKREEDQEEPAVPGEEDSLVHKTPVSAQ